jgi:hypothetical protein
VAARFQGRSSVTRLIACSAMRAVQLARIERCETAKSERKAQSTGIRNTPRAAAILAIFKAQQDRGVQRQKKVPIPPESIVPCALHPQCNLVRPAEF